MKNAKDYIIWQTHYFCTNRVIPKDLETKDLAYLGMVCSVSLEKLRKLNK